MQDQTSDGHACGDWRVYDEDGCHEAETALESYDLPARDNGAHVTPDASLMDVYWACLSLVLGKWFRSLRNTIRMGMHGGC